VDRFEESCWVASRYHCHEREIGGGGWVVCDRCTMADDAPAYSEADKAWPLSIGNARDVNNVVTNLMNIGCCSRSLALCVFRLVC
jgi:hypothetical protein